MEQPERRQQGQQGQHGGAQAQRHPIHRPQTGRKFEQGQAGVEVMAADGDVAGP
jgi:hypothetical protein